MASSGTYKDRTFNLAAQGHRQPGSAFKTMVLAAAIRAGVDPDSDHVHLEAAEHRRPGLRATWEVKTYGNTYSGTMNLSRATLASDNTVYAQLILDLGPRRSARRPSCWASRTKLDCYPAEGLGGLRLGVTPLEMAERVRDARGGRHAQPADGDQEGRVPRRQVARTSASPSASACSPTARPTRSRRSSSRTCRRHRHRGEHRLPRGRQDRHDRRVQRRLVRGLHAEALDGRVGRLSERAGVACSARHRLGRRRHVPGARSGTTSWSRPRATTATTSRSPPSRPSSRRSSASTRPPASAGTGEYYTPGTEPGPATDAGVRPALLRARPRSTRPNAEPPPRGGAPKPEPGRRRRGNGTATATATATPARGGAAGADARGRARADRGDRAGDRQPRRQGGPLERRRRGGHARTRRSP